MVLPGLQVRLCGLQRSELNGLYATCIMPVRDRYRVRLDGGEEKALRREFLLAQGHLPLAVCPQVRQELEQLEVNETWRWR